MAEKTTAEQIADRINDLQHDLDDLYNEVNLNSIQEDVSDLSTELQAMPRRIQDARKCGYIFMKDLEDTVMDLAKNWKGQLPGIKSRINRESRRLRKDFDELKKSVDEISRRRPMSSMISQIERLESKVSSFEDEVDAVDRSISGMVEDISGEFDEINTKLENVEWMLEALDEASFELLAAENPVMAVKTKWFQDGKEDKKDPEGVLYLTDKRLIFEQKQKIAKKKVLFITTESELVQKLLLEVPVGAVGECEIFKTGMFKGKENIEISFVSDSPVQKASFLLHEHNGEFLEHMIKQAASGEIYNDRAVEVDEKVIEKVKSAPTECPNCGAAINQKILRGMDSITCKYCGTVIRL